MWRLVRRPQQYCLTNLLAVPRLRSTINRILLDYALVAHASQVGQALGGHFPNSQRLRPFIEHGEIPIVGEYPIAPATCELASDAGPD